MQLNYPWRIDGRGRTAEAPPNEHIRQLMEQVLFTSPGERINRPDFGSGVMQLIFAPNSDELATASEFLVQGALQQWLGELLQIEAVTIQSEEETLHITVQYLLRSTQERQVAEFRQGVLS